jgi:hypothetical protein
MIVAERLYRQIYDAIVLVRYVLVCSACALLKLVVKASRPN